MKRRRGKITAVIPTRAGSERVKQKNIRDFADSNLLEIKIASMLKLLDQGLIDEVMLNTNCPVSIETAEKYNIKYHARDDVNASSNADTREYWKDCAREIDTDVLLLAQVTSPFISHITYRECIAKYQQGDFGGDGGSPVENSVKFGSRFQREVETYIRRSRQPEQSSQSHPQGREGRPAEGG